MPLTLAVLSDIHYGAPTIPRRKGDLGAVLLERAVRRFNRWMRPDAVALLGDCIDDSDAADATDRLRELRSILDRLECPWVAIPGNHDPEPDRFYAVMPRPADTVDIGPIRLVPFIDPGTPDYHATRSDAQLARTAAARRDGFGGAVVALQHVPPYPRAMRERLVYGYTNDEAVLAAMDAGGVDLSIGGHCHTGSGLIAHSRTRCLAADALCETPHRYTLVTIDGPRITSRAEPLAMPADLGLVDYHGHTQFAYCSENMHTTRSARVAEAMGLRGVAMTEHSGQLYVPEEEYWSGRFCGRGVDGARPGDCRAEAYLSAARAAQREAAEREGPAVLVGFEVDVDYAGRPVLRPEDRERADLLIGAVHHLPPPGDASGQGRAPAAKVEAFKAATAGLVRGGIDALAHPFRIFGPGYEPPAELCEWLARLLHEHGVAAELNYHNHEPYPPFVARCIDLGVKLTFGGDAHHLAEIGEFYPQLRLLERLGVTGDPSPHVADLLPQGSARATARG